MSKRNPAIAPAVAVCTIELQQSGGAVQIFPAGEFGGARGSLRGQGPWRIDEQSAAALIVATQAYCGSQSLKIDYEHQTLLSAENGQPSPAAGWIDPAKLEWRDGQGLFATDVKWTDRAAAYLAADEYRYLSPVFSYDPSTKMPLRLGPPALTNTPALDMPPVVQAAATAALSTATPETVMDADDLMTSICYLLNLPLTSSKEEVLAQIDKMKEIIAKAPAEAAAAGLFGLLNAKDAEIAALKSAASSAAVPDPAQFAPVAAMQALQAEVAALRAETVGRKVEELVCAALSDGRLVAAQEKWARDLGQTNLAKLQEYLGVTPNIAALSGTQTGGKPPVGGAAQQQTSDDVAVMKALGLTSEQFAAGKVEV
jgi:phage I-like protein